MDVSKRIDSEFASFFFMLNIFFIIFYLQEILFVQIQDYKYLSNFTLLDGSLKVKPEKIVLV